MAKKCRQCGVKFNARNSLHVACSPRCAIDLAQTKTLKKRRGETLAMKRDLNNNDRQYQLKQAQSAFNRYIRLRDEGLPCISCQRMHSGQIHAGHYRSVGAHPELRFNADNCHAQCMPCNTHLSGNIVNYRINLIDRIGIERVEAVEKWERTEKLTIDGIKGIKSKFKILCKKLESGK